MYMATLECKRTKHRTKVFVGCADMTHVLTSNAAQPKASFLISEFTAVSDQLVNRVIKTRSSNDQELIDRAIMEAH